MFKERKLKKNLELEYPDMSKRDIKILVRIILEVRRRSKLPHYRIPHIA